MQIIFVYIIIALSVSYIVWRVYKAIRADDNPCRGCDGCALRDIKNKKDCEKFGRKK